MKDIPREKLLEVIRELEQAEARHLATYRDKWSDNREYHDGASDGLRIAIDKLRGLLE